MRAYGKNLRRMFKANIVRLCAISLIVSIGIAVTTGICAIPVQMRDAIDLASFSPQELLLVNAVADKIEAIGYVFPPFFIFVSCLSALTTITRLMEEERPVFACYKTLGYSNFSVIVRYLIFAAVCALLGCIIGLLAGDFLLRPIIFNVIKIKFNLPYISGVYWSHGLIWSGAMCAAILTCSLVIAALRCAESPAELLRHKAPRAGKKIFLEYLPFFWKRLKFKFKSAVRNIFRYKGKLVMTVVSVSGATIMVFAGLGLVSSVNSEQNKNIQAVAGFADSMNAISAIITLCGIALAVLVLFNLTNMNIEERRREIATLKVLGYNPLEVAGFIYRELMILSVIGILIGLPSGYCLTGFLFEYLDFGSLELVEWFVWVGTTAIAILSVFLADALLYKKISKIEMISSLKIVD